MSSSKNGIICVKCGAYSEANKVQLRSYGISGALAGMKLLNWTFQMFKSNDLYWLLGLIVTILFFVFTMYLMNLTLKFKISNQPIAQIEDEF